VTTALQSTGAATITERLAEHVVGLRYEDLPASVVQQAKHHLAYLIGSAFRGHGRDGGRRAVWLAQELGGGDRCSIVGDRRKAGLVDAVFANSFLIICTGLDDYLLPEGLHPGVIAQPVALAFGENSNASGRELLTAVVAGYDVMGSLCDPSLTWGLDAYRPALFVLEPFGAAATAARLLGLSRERTVHALGHAGQVGRHIAGTGKHAQAMHPLLARNGATAAVLAKSGMTASPTVIEGRYGVFRSFFSCDVPDSVRAGLESLGHEFVITRARTRRHTAVPLSGYNIIPVELTQRLVEEHALSAAHVATVEIALPEERRAREDKREDAITRSGADSVNRMESLGLRIAMVVAGGPIEPGRFERPPDPELLAQRDKVRLLFEQGRPLLYARVEVTTTHGERYTAEGDTPVAPPADWTEWLAEGSRGVIPEDRLNRLVHLIRHLEDVPDVSELLACVVPEEK
jgi:2-methylcitrate dehydratase PrpD